MTAHLGQVGPWGDLWHRQLGGIGPALLAGQGCDHLSQRGAHQDLPVGQLRFGGILRRHDHPGCSGGLDQRQHTPHAAHRAVETQFAEQAGVLDCGGIELTGGDQVGDGDRQVQRRTALAQAGGCQVDRDDLAAAERETGVEDRRPDPIARLPARRIGQADHDEPGKSHLGDVYLDPYAASIDTEQGCGRDGGQHDASSFVREGFVMEWRGVGHLRAVH